MVGDEANDRGAAFKRWVQESWGPAYRKWRQLVPPFRVRVREVGGQDEQGKPVPLLEDLPLSPSCPRRKWCQPWGGHPVKTATDTSSRTPNPSWRQRPRLC